MERDGSRGRGEHGQATAEWVALLLLVSLLITCLIAAALRIPVSSLARSITTRILCAVSRSDACRETPALVSAYGEELAAQVRRHAPSLAYEDGMRALPVDFRRCRSSRCGDGAEDGVVTRSLAGEPVVAFVHVVDCRRRAAARTERLGGNCSEGRGGNLYLQYWTYYADSATMRGVPVAAGHGYHRDDWEGTHFRIGPDGDVDQRASSHHGYNCEQGAGNWGSDAGIAVLTAVSEALGARPSGGWCAASRWLFVSGGSHAGGVRGNPADVGRITPRRRMLLVPLEPIARNRRTASFAVAPPWVKRVWWDPEAEGTS